MREYFERICDANGWSFRTLIGSDYALAADASGRSVVMQYYTETEALYYDYAGIAKEA